MRIINQIEGEEDLAKEANLIKTLQKDTGDLTKVYEEQTNSQRTRLTVTEKTNSAGVRQRDVQKETLAQGPKFKMHFLGIMFGGMALNRAMSNLTATSKEWVGMGEIMSTTMGVVMLPATMNLLEFGVLPLAEALLSLPEEIQTVIGVTVLGLEGLGKIAEVGGQIALGAAAFKYQFPKMAKAIGVGLTSAIATQLAAGIVVGVGVIIAWSFAKSIKTAISEGELKDEVIGVLGTGFGLGIAGAAIGGLAFGPVGAAAGAAIGFTLGVSIGILIDWFYGGTVGKTFMETLPNVLGFSNSLKQPLPIKLTRDLFKSDEFSGLDLLMNILPTKPKPFGFAVGGNVSESGNYFLHQGETVLRKDQAANQGANLNVTYNVKVSDKREFEKMLQTNNQQLVREVRRII